MADPPFVPADIYVGALRPFVPSRVYLALGSNLGRRREQMVAAVDALDAHPDIRVTAVSSLYETTPVGGPPGQPDYLNAVVAVETSLSPEALLDVTQSVEARLGRERGVLNGPRTIDIDILMYEGEPPPTGRPDAAPVIPHPRMHERAFVLRPLADLAADTVHPHTGRTVTQLLREVGTAEIRKVRSHEWVRRR